MGVHLEKHRPGFIEQIESDNRRVLSCLASPLRLVFKENFSRLVFDYFVRIAICIDKCHFGTASDLEGGCTSQNRSLSNPVRITDRSSEWFECAFGSIDLVSGCSCLHRLLLSLMVNDLFALPRAGHSPLTKFFDRLTKTTSDFSRSCKSVSPRLQNAFRGCRAS